MAVYTHLGAEDMAALIAAYDVGTLVSAKGIAEGVSNSNWLIDTTGRDGTGARYILTMYEFRIDLDDLPYFLSLLDHLAAQGCPVPRTIHDRSGALYRRIGGQNGESKAVALIEFLPGVSVSAPTVGQAHAVGVELARLHLAARDFPIERPNALSVESWRPLYEHAGARGDGRALEPFAQPEPAQRNVAKHEFGGVDHAIVARQQTVGDNGCRGCEALRQPTGGCAGHGVERKPDRRRPGGGVHALRQIRAVDQDDVGTFGLQPGDLIRPAHQAHRADAPQAGKLDDAVADAGIAGVLQDPFARLERPEPFEHLPGGRRIDRHHRQLQRICALRQDP